MENIASHFYYVKVFIAVLVLVNPLEGIPFFLTNTSQLTPEQRSLIAKKSATAVLVILISALFFGKYILMLFGISNASFSFSGGVIIFLIAINMVIGKSDTGEKSLPKDPTLDMSDIAIVPIAIPLLAGPGAISSMMVYGSRSSGIWEDLIICGIAFLIAVAVKLSLDGAAKMQKILGDTGIKVLTKISGLLVAAIAIEMIYRATVQFIEYYSKAASTLN